MLFNIFPSIYIVVVHPLDFRQFDFYLLYFFRFHFPNRTPPSFDDYCYLYDFAALLKAEKCMRGANVNLLFSQVVEFVHNRITCYCSSPSPTNSLIIFSCTAATRVLFNFLWSQLAMFLSWHHVIKSNLCHPSFTTVVVIIIIIVVVLFIKYCYCLLL